MKTIRSEWEQFHKLILVPAHAGAVQVQETQRAFYAGAQTMLALISSACPADESDDAGVLRLEALNKELEQYAVDLQEGRA